MLSGLAEGRPSGYASVSPDGEAPPEEPEEPARAAGGRLCGCRRPWVVRLVVTCLFLALLVLAAVAMDVTEGAGAAPQGRSRLRDASGPPGGGRALLWSVPWFQSVSNGVCEAAEKVLLHPFCQTTTSTTTTTTTETSTTRTSTTVTTSSTSSTTETTTTSSTLTSSTTTSRTSTSTTTTTTPHPLWPWPSTVAGTRQKRVVKGISYAPVPLRRAGAVLPDDDFMSSNTSGFWGPRSHGSGGRGRRDLEIIAALGANAVRLYGNDPALDHGPFLDEAARQGLDVVAGLSDYPYVQMPGSCLHTSYDCYGQIRRQYAQNLRNGFLSRGGRRYHPALRMVILMNEPDLKFEGGLQGFPGEPKHFCKALISAFDAVLSAEQEAGVEGPAPNFTVAFSFGRCAKCYSFQSQPSLGQMLELRHAMQHPHSVNYTARNDLWWAYQRRFVNSFNTQNSASEMRHLFLDAYDANFRSTPVFIGEYHAPVVPDQEADLKEILRMAEDGSTMLAGFSFFEFQVRYDKGGGEMNFGMFGLSETDIIAEERISFKTYTSWCLTPVRAKSLGQHCGHLQTDVDYVVESTWHQSMDHIPTAELCCSECQKAHRCRVWTWVRDARLDGCPSQCWLKGAGAVREEPKGGVVSGLLHSEEPQEVAYVHDALARAYGGSGLGLQQLCPVATTTEPATTTPPRPRSSAAAPRSPEMLVSASWVGCYARGALAPERAGRRPERGGPLSTAACAKACRSVGYMYLQGDGRCRCGDRHPSKLDCQLERDEECSGRCLDDSGNDAAGYCGDSLRFAVYSIQVSSGAADEEQAASA